MHDPSVPTWHVSRPLPMPAADAALALDLLLREGAIRCEPGGSALRPVLIAVNGSRRYRPVRRLRGLLRLGGLAGAVRVEVQLDPWSYGRSELGVRPAARPPLAWRATRYFAAVTALLDDLIGRLLAAVPPDDATHARLRWAS